MSMLAEPATTIRAGPSRPGAGHAGSTDGEPEPPQGRRQEISQRIGAIRTQIDELEAKCCSGTGKPMTLADQTRSKR